MTPPSSSFAVTAFARICCFLLLLQPATSYSRFPLLPVAAATLCNYDWFDYSVNPGQSARFYPEIRKYFPNLKDESLEPGYSGIRAKLCGPKQPPQDFVIQGEDVHGVPGLINLFGIESPGLTSSLAIAECVASKLES